MSGPNDSAAEMIEREAMLVRLGEEMKKRQSPAGKLGLPELLDERRLKYAITDGAFSIQPAFDRLFVLQIPFDEGETYGGGLIVKTSTSQKREAYEAPRGLIISAGLTARDELRAHGMWLGHMVRFIKQLAWQVPIDTVNNKTLYITPLIVGDIVASEDLATELQSGECKIINRTFKTEDGLTGSEHVYVDKDGETWAPVAPFLPEDQ